MVILSIQIVWLVGYKKYGTILRYGDYKMACLQEILVDKSTNYLPGREPHLVDEGSPDLLHYRLSVAVALKC